MRALLLAGPLAGSLALAGCAVTPVGVAYNPNPPPPPLRVEIVPKPPVSEEPLILQPGHWDWDGQGWVWRESAWVPRAGHGTTWQDGYWSNASGAWLWVPGHWT